MQIERFTPCGSRVCVLKIMSYESKNPVGILQNPNFDSDMAFRSLAELVFAMENLFDDINSPQRTMEPRGGVRQPELRPAEAADGKPLATFTVNVMFRQNASWQGNVIWTETRRESQFRSLLELIALMDSVLAPDAQQATA